MKARTAGCIIAALTVIVIASLLLYARITVTTERVRLSLVASLEEVFGCSFSCKHITVGIFNGIRLENVRIDLPLEEEGAFEGHCKEARLGFSLSGLLLKKLVIRDIELKEPRFFLELDAMQKAARFTRQRQVPLEAAPLKVVFLPGSISLDGGSAVLSSQSTGVRIPLDRISLKAPHVSLIMPFDVTACAYIEGASDPAVLCTGTYWFARHEVNGNVTLQDSAATLLKAFTAGTGIVVEKGSSRITSTISGSPSRVLTTTVELGIQDVTAFASSLPGAGLEGIDLRCEGQIVWNAEKKVCSFEQVKGSVCGSEFSGGGQVDFGVRLPSCNVQFTAPSFSFDALCDRLRFQEGSPLQGLKLAGTGALRFLLETDSRGTVTPVLLVDLRGNKIIYPPLRTLQPEVSGSLRFDEKRITLSDLKIGTANLSSTLAGDVSGYLQGSPRSSVKVVSSRVDLVEMFSYRPGDRPAEDIGPFDFKGLTLGGPLQLGTTSLFGIPVGNVHGSYELKNNRLSLSNVCGTVAEQGAFKFGFSVDLGVRGLEYTARLEFGNFPVPALSSPLGFDLSSFVTGSLSGTCILAGRGTTPAGFFENLTGEAELALENGRVKGLGLPDQILSFLKSDALRELVFSDARLRVTLSNGAMRLAEGAILSRSIQILPAGTVGIDGSLDLTATLKIAEGLFEEGSKIVSYLPRSEGWVTVPVLIKGTIDRPRVTLSEEAMTYLMQEVLPRLLMDMMGQPADNTTADNESGR